MGQRVTHAVTGICGISRGQGVDGVGRRRGVAVLLGSARRCGRIESGGIRGWSEDSTRLIRTRQAIVRRHRSHMHLILRTWNEGLALGVELGPVVRVDSGGHPRHGTIGKWRTRWHPKGGLLGIPYVGTRWVVEWNWVVSEAGCRIGRARHEWRIGPRLRILRHGISFVLSIMDRIPCRDLRGARCALERLHASLKIR